MVCNGGSNNTNNTNNNSCNTKDYCWCIKNNNKRLWIHSNVNSLEKK